jgi:hypothetical protein
MLNGADFVIDPAEDVVPIGPAAHESVRAEGQGRRSSRDTSSRGADSPSFSPSSQTSFPFRAPTDNFMKEAGSGGHPSDPTYDVQMPLGSNLPSQRPDQTCTAAGMVVASSPGDLLAR